MHAARSFGPARGRSANPLAPALHAQLPVGPCRGGLASAIPSAGRGGSELVLAHGVACPLISSFMSSLVPPDSTSSCAGVEVTASRRDRRRTTAPIACVAPDGRSVVCSVRPRCSCVHRSAIVRRARWTGLARERRRHQALPLIPGICIQEFRQLYLSNCTHIVSRLYVEPATIGR